MEPYDFILETIQEAGVKLLQAREEGFKVMTKGGDSRDIVTSADQEISTFLVSRIQEHFPDHAVYSEEGEGDLVVEGHHGEHKWVIDPIDGSANFSRGIPHFAISLGLLHKGVPVCGAVYNPVTKELFSFKKDEGVFLNGKPIHVSNVTELSGAHVLFHAGRKESLRVWGGESYKRLLGNAKKTKNLGSSSLDICFLSAGRIEVYVSGTLSTLDIAAALGILTEAGGVMSDEEGKEITLSKEPQKVFIANSNSMLEQVRTLLSD